MFSHKVIYYFAIFQADVSFIHINKLLIVSGKEAVVLVNAHYIIKSYAVKPLLKATYE